MRKPIKQVVLSVLIVGASILSVAQEDDSARVADHEALRALKEKVVQALNARDVAALTSCLAKQYALTTVDQKVLTSESQIREYFQKTFEAPDCFVTSLKLQADADVLTQFLGDDAGYCYGTTTEAYTMKEGKVVTMKNRWTATVVKENGEWKVAAAHGAANFLDNPLLAKIRSQIWVFGGGGLIVGLLLGLGGAALLCKLRGRQST